MDNDNYNQQPDYSSQYNNPNNDYERQLSDGAEAQRQRDAAFNRYDTFNGVQNTSNMEEYFAAEKYDRERRENMERELQNSNQPYSANNTNPYEPTNTNPYAPNNTKNYTPSSSGNFTRQKNRNQGFGRQEEKPEKLSKEEKLAQEQIELFTLKLQNAFTKSEVIRITMENEIKDNPSVDPEKIKSKYSDAIYNSNEELSLAQENLHAYQNAKETFKEMKESKIASTEFKSDGTIKGTFLKYSETLGRLACGAGGAVAATIGTLAAFSSGTSIAVVAWPAFVAVGAIGIVSAVLAKPAQNELEKSRYEHETGINKFLRVGANAVCKTVGATSMLGLAGGAATLALTSSGFSIAALGSLAAVGLLARKQKKQQETMYDELGLNVGKESKYIQSKNDVLTKINDIRDTAIDTSPKSKIQP